jgi:hypothetical protein
VPTHRFISSQLERALTAVPCLLLAAGGAEVGAQRAPRVDVVVAAEAGVLPDALTTRCGRGGSGMAGGGALLGVRVQPRETGVFAQLDLRSTHAEAGGCSLDVPLRWLSPTEYEIGPLYEYGSAPRAPLGATLLRVGLVDGNSVVRAGVYGAGGLA